MSVEENSRIIEEWFTAINAHDVDRYLALFSDDVVLQSTAIPEPVQGKEALRQQVVDIFAAFPDYQVEMKNAVISEDQFVPELEVRGTHKAQLNMGPGVPPVPPTGKQIRLKGIFAATVKDGKVSEVHQYPNIMGMMTQLGLMSPPGAE